MNIMRLFLYFLVGFMISAAASFSFAGSYRVGTYYRYGDSLTRKVTSGADAKKLSDIVMKVHLDDQKNARVTTQIAMNLESNLVQSRILDQVPIPASAAAAAAASALKKGRINPGAIVANLLADYAVQKGWEMMKDAQCEMKAGGCWNAPAGGINESNASDCDSYSLAWGQKGTYIVHIPGWVCVQTMGGGPSFNSDKCFWKNNVPVGGGEFAGYYWCRETTPVKYAQSSPATQNDVDNLAKEYYYNYTQPLFEGFMKEGTIFDLDDNTPVTTSGDPVTGPKSVSASGTTKNADGTESQWQTETQTTYTPKGDGKAGGEIKIDKTTTTTTTTNTCTGAGSCTTNSNTTTTKPPDEQKTDCDKHPNAIGCAAFGDPPSITIPESTQNVSFEWNPFSLPALCPPDYVFTLSNGMTYHYSFEWFCRYASAMKTVILLAAFVAAYYICFGARKGDL